MSKSSPYKSCFFVLLDGARPDALGQLLAQGKMPNFFETFVKNGTFTKATSVFPSTTGPAYLPYLTGHYPGTCNIPGIRWFDRKEYRFRSYVGAEAYLFNQDLSKNVSTLFEKFKNPVNIFSPISRGVGLGGNHAHLKKIFYALYAKYTGDWKYVDRKLTDHAIKALNKNPDFTFLALPAVDEISHHSHPFAEDVIAAYLQFDGLLGKIRAKLSKQKKLDETLFVCAADHGLSATQKHFDLVKFIENLGHDVFHYPKLYKREFDVAVMESGNAMAHLYCKNGKGWEQRAFAKECAKIIEPLAQQPEISWVAALDDEQRVLIKSKDGQALLKEQGGKIFYTVTGKDPLSFKKAPAVMTPEQSLEFSFNETYPDAFVQLIQLFKSPRTGDIVVNAEKGCDLRLGFEFPEHHSSHGSLHRDHMFVPVAFSHLLDHQGKIRSVDVFPTILKLMGMEEEKQCDGLSLVA